MVTTPSGIWQASLVTAGFGRKVLLVPQTLNQRPEVKPFVGRSRISALSLQQLGHAFQLGTRQQARTAASCFIGQSHVIGLGSGIVILRALRRQRRGSSRVKQRAGNRTVALLGSDGAAKSTVRNVLIGNSAVSCEEEEEQSANRVWCAHNEQTLTLLEAPGHVDFLTFVDISQRVCASSLLVMPFDVRGTAPVDVELAAHWVRSVEKARKPLGVVFCAPDAEIGTEDVTQERLTLAFAKALADLRRLGLNLIPLSVPALVPSSGLRRTRRLASVVPEAATEIKTFPAQPAGLVQLTAACRARSGVPVVFLAGSAGSAVKDSRLFDLVGQVLPSVDDIVDGRAAGCWEGVDPQSGYPLMICPDSSGTFAGIAFQTTYLQKGSWKAYDVLVVRGTWRAGQPLLNATTGKHLVFADQFECTRGGTCGGKQKTEAGPGEVIRVTMPADKGSPGSGGSLCWWCDPLAPVRLPILHEHTYASIAGLHCTHALKLDGVPKSSQERLFGAIARTIEEDQSLRIECWDNSEVHLTACGSEQLRRLRRRLLSHWGVRMALQPCRIPYRATLKREALVKLLVGAGNMRSSIMVKVGPLPRGEGIRVVAGDEVLHKIGGMKGWEAFVRGVRQTCARGLPIVHRSMAKRTRQNARVQRANGRLPVDDIKVELQEVDSLMGPYGAASLEPALLRAVGAQSVRRAAGRDVISSVSYPAGSAPVCVLEPVADVFVKVPRRHLRHVVSDLRARGGQLQFVRRSWPLLVSVKATVPQRRLRRYGRTLAAITESTATFSAQERGYVEVNGASGPSISALVRNVASPPASQQGCPLVLWGDQ